LLVVTLLPMSPPPPEVSPVADPPDRSHIRTEQRHDDSHNLDALTTSQGIALLIDDHRRVTSALQGAADDLAVFIDELMPRMEAGGRLIYLGAGTSGRLGVLDAAECPPTFQCDPGQVVGIIAGGDTALRRSSEAKEDDPNGAAPDLNAIELCDRDAVVGIAAGGTTPWVLGALTIARKRGAMTALLTCSPPREPPTNCDHLIVLDTGSEVLTGSTRLKAGSATKLALNIISTMLFTKLGKVYSNLMVDLRASNAKLHDRAIRILIELCPNLSRAQAAARLDDADNDLKTAIVMERLGVSQQEAEVRLHKHRGRLRPSLE